MKVHAALLAVLLLTVGAQRSAAFVLWRIECVDAAACSVVRRAVGVLEVIFSVVSETKEVTKFVLDDHVPILGIRWARRILVGDPTVLVGVGRVAPLFSFWLILDP